MTELSTKTIGSLFKETVGAALPTGAILCYAGHATPDGYLFCDGSLVSRTTYPKLFTVIGTHFGAGDGSTTFGVPDLRGRTMLGRDDIGGTAATRENLNTVLINHTTYSDPVPTAMGTLLGARLVINYIIKASNPLPDLATAYPPAPA